MSAPIFLLNAQYLPASRDWWTSDGADSPFAVETFLRAARRAEDAGFDAFFQADFSGVDRAALRSGPPLTAFEPLQMAALVASATQRIAVMPTVSTLHTHPFSFARSLASLDRISNGRAWINIVSSFRSGTALGAQRTIAHDRRHAQTEEFVDVARRLWASWPPTANVSGGARCSGGSNRLRRPRRPSTTARPFPRAAPRDATSTDRLPQDLLPEEPSEALARHGTRNLPLRTCPCRPEPA